MGKEFLAGACTRVIRSIDCHYLNLELFAVDARLWINTEDDAKKNISEQRYGLAIYKTNILYFLEDIISQD